MSRTRFRLITLILATFFVSACVTKPLATDGSATVAADQGLMAVRFISNWKGNENAIFEELAFGVRLDDASMNEVLEMRNNDDAQLIALPAGRYTWTHATIGSSYIGFVPGTDFTISPGQVTYVGDVTLNITQRPFVLIAEGLAVENNEEETMARLRSDYGELLDKYSVTAEIADLALAN